MFWLFQGSKITCQEDLNDSHPSFSECAINQVRQRYAMI